MNKKSKDLYIYYLIGMKLIKYCEERLNLIYAHSKTHLDFITRLFWEECDWKFYLLIINLENGTHINYSDFSII